jgi:hypothetical protein
MALIRRRQSIHSGIESSGRSIPLKVSRPIESSSRRSDHPTPRPGARPSSSPRCPGWRSRQARGRRGNERASHCGPLPYPAKQGTVPFFIIRFNDGQTWVFFLHKKRPIDRSMGVPDVRVLVLRIHRFECSPDYSLANLSPYSISF